MTSVSSVQRPSMCAAAAKDKHRFSAAFGHLELDDAFSIIVTYDEFGATQWNRFAVKQEINAATALPDNFIFAGANFALSSMEGDIYFVGDGKLLHEKIPGTGLYTADMPKAGQMFGIGYVNGRLLAAGAKNQIFERLANNSWRPIFPATRPVGHYELPIYDLIVETAAGGIYVVGFARPDKTRLYELAALMHGDKLLTA